MNEHDDDDRYRQRIAQWWYLPAVVAVVGLMMFVVLWLLPAMP